DAKAVLGENVEVLCDLAADGHDLLTGEVRHRHEKSEWQRVPLVMRYPGRWVATFPAAALGRLEFQVEAWVDRFGTWRTQTEARLAAGQDISVELLVGAELLRQAADRAG